MTNFVIGQKVRIRQWDDMEREFGLNCNGNINLKNSYTFIKSMKHLCGRVATITKFSSYNNTISLDFEDKSGDTHWSYSTDMIKPYEFTKADLKDGMVIETRDGKRFIYLNGHASGIKLHMRLSTHEEDLTYSSSKDLDIVKVFKVNSKVYGLLEDILNNDKYLDLIWERKEPKVKELTTEEAIELLKEKFAEFDEIKITV